jgi:hypothetical protein
MWAAYQAEMAKRAEVAAATPVRPDAPCVLVCDDTEPFRSASPASAFPQTKLLEPKSE